MPKLIFDINRAKEAWKNEIRYSRIKALEKLDVDFMRATEAGTDTTSIVADKQTLRDLPTVVDTATSKDEIVAVWNDMLGDKPTT
jgi:hypothetical protein